MIRDKDFKHKIALSPSRIDTFLSCSAIYAAKYIYKIPDAGNSGSKRGSVTHDTLEILDNKRHEKVIARVLNNKSCKNEKGLWRLVRRYAKKYGVDNTTDLDLIDSFIYTALATDFFGPEGTVETYNEKNFDFEVESENGEISYRLKGFIDRSFLYKKGNNLYIKICDWKTSKKKFEDDKKDANNQSICYQIAASKYLFPQYTLTDFHFIFLKFPKKPVMAVDLKESEFIHGYEMWLTHIQNQIENFTEKNINDNFAALKPADQWLCGREGLKKDGTPNFLCSCRKPMDYYVVVDKDKKIKVSGFTKEELKISEGESIEKRFYPGCNYYYNSRGVKRSSESS